MKTLRIISLLPITMLLASVAFSQSLKVSTYTEVTRVSPKVGTSIGIVLQGYAGNIEIGGFYQKNSVTSQTEYKSRMSEQNFKGIYGAFSFYNNDLVDLSFKVRTGTINDEIFAIVPSVHGEFSLTQSFGFTLGAGVRVGMPSGHAGLTLKI
jgi:hypothetical protein